MIAMASPMPPTTFDLSIDGMTCARRNWRRSCR